MLQLAREAMTALWERPGRSALTMLGAVFGVGTFIAVLGGAATANGQISKAFTELSATQVEMTPVAGADQKSGGEFPAHAEERVARIDGVSSAGRRIEWIPRAPVSKFPPLTPAESADVPVVAVSPGFWTAARTHLADGRLFDGYLATARVAVLGQTVAQRLSVSLGRPNTSTYVYVNDVQFLVVGIVVRSERDPETAGAVYVPAKVAPAAFGPARSTAPPTLLIETRLGAAEVVQRQAALAVDPYEPHKYRAVTAAQPTVLRDQVSRDLGTIFLLLAAVSLIIGSLGIANTTLIAVLERVPEIGLRRALGASHRDVAAQFLLEAALLGGSGGVVGTALGVLVTVGLAVAKGWTAVLPHWALVSGPVLGCLAGLLAGLYPAWRASRVEPVVALRR